MAEENAETKQPLEIGEQRHLIYGGWMVNEKDIPKWGRFCFVVKRSIDGYRCYLSTAVREAYSDKSLIAHTCRRGTKMPREIVRPLFGFDIPEKDWAW